LFDTNQTKRIFVNIVFTYIRDWSLLPRNAGGKNTSALNLYIFFFSFVFKESIKTTKYREKPIGYINCYEINNDDHKN